MYASRVVCILIPINFSPGYTISVVQLVTKEKKVDNNYTLKWSCVDRHCTERSRRVFVYLIYK